MAAILEPLPGDRARAELAVQGYRGLFTVGDDGLVCCDVCGVCHEPDAIRTPDSLTVDGVVVLAAACPCCGQRGTAVSPPTRPAWCDLMTSEGGIAFG